jgi:hypothetical protein
LSTVERSAKIAAAKFVAYAEYRSTMLFEQIENQKRQYTDKYVVVDGTRPELARFKDVVGQVKTVNMSGRALVEFLDYHLNIGWYDIDPQFLKVVDKPLPKPAKPEEKKPAEAEAKPAAAAKTPAKAPAAAPKAGKPSVADILAAARAGKTATGEAASAAVKSKPETATLPVVEKPAAATPAKVDRSKMSVADMLAAARAGGAAGAAKPQAKPEPVPEVAPKTPEGVATSVAVAPEEPPAPKASDKIDKSKMSIDDMLAWCRQHDTK